MTTGVQSQRTILLPGLCHFTVTRAIYTYYGNKIGYIIGSHDMDHMRTHTHTHTYLHAHAHTHTHTHTCTHTHSQDEAPSVPPKVVEQPVTSINLDQDGFLGLDVNVSYTIIVYAENLIGTGEDSNEISYTRNSDQISNTSNGDAGDEVLPLAAVISIAAGGGVLLLILISLFCFSKWAIRLCVCVCVCVYV